MVESGEFKLDANFRFVMTTNRLTTVGLYEVEVQAPDGSPIDLLDYSFSIVKCLRFMVGPAQGSQLGAKISCADRVYNGASLMYTLSSNHAMHLVIRSTRTPEAVCSRLRACALNQPCRNPLQPSAGQAQIVQVCTIELKLW